MSQRGWGVLLDHRAERDLPLAVAEALERAIPRLEQDRFGRDPAWTLSGFKARSCSGCDSADTASSTRSIARGTTCGS